MSTKCQHSWNCVPLMPVKLCWYFPLVSSKLDETVFTQIAAVGNKHTVHCDVTVRSWQVSTSMVSSASYQFSSKLETFRLNWNVYLNHSTNELCIYCDYFPSSSPKVNFRRMSTPQCHKINVVTFDAECHEICFVGRKTNVMTLMSWDLENVMTFISTGTGARPT